MEPQQEHQNSPSEAVEHVLAAKVLAASGGSPGAAVVLTGYLVRGPNDDTWRLYSSLAFNNYVDIPKEALLASENLPNDQGTRVWVRVGTQLVQTQVSTRSVAAELLSGSISSRAAQTAARSVIPAPDQTPRNAWVKFTQLENCTWYQTHCPGCWPNRGTDVGCHEPDTWAVDRCVI